MGARRGRGNFSPVRRSASLAQEVAVRDRRRAGALALLVVGLLVALTAAWWGGAVPDAAPVSPAAAATPERRRVVRAPLVPPDLGMDEAEDTGEAPEEEPYRTQGLGELFGDTLPLARVRAQVRTAEGEAAWRGMPVVTGCELHDMLYLGPGLWMLEVIAGTCAIQGRAPDGLLYARSDWEELELAAGELVELELVLPEERTGGLGVQISEHDHGVLVDRVLPGTPADDMGLVAGDLIVEVDGLPTTALDLDEFIEVMTGPAGTEVEFVLELDGDTGFSEEVLTLTREVLTES